jgi:hypothetical protein
MNPNPRDDRPDDEIIPLPNENGCLRSLMSLMCDGLSLLVTGGGHCGPWALQQAAPIAVATTTLSCAGFGYCLFGPSSGWRS